LKRLYTDYNYEFEAFDKLSEANQAEDVKLKDLKISEFYISMNTLGDSFMAEQWLNNDPDYIESIKNKKTVALRDRANRRRTHASEG